MALHTACRAVCNAQSFAVASFCRSLAAMPALDSLRCESASEATASGRDEAASRRIAEMEERGLAASRAMQLREAARRRLQQQSTLFPDRSADAARALRAPRAEQPLDWRHVVAAGAVQAAPSLAMLTDRFQREHTYLRISLTERCNLRCQYCMPAEGVDLTPSAQLLTLDEIDRLVRTSRAGCMVHGVTRKPEKSGFVGSLPARIFVEAGVDKIRLTGGEPTTRADLVPIAERLGRLPGLRTLAMTTNGVVLARQLPALRRAGMSALNISLDTLRPERFEAMTRRKGHERVLQAISAAVEQGFAVKVNVVVMRGQNDDEINDFVELTRSARINVRFIEYMPFDDNAWTKQKMFTYQETIAHIQAKYGPLMRQRDPRGEVAKNFYIPGFQGSVSFITSMTEHFCSDCNRLRLMADGNLKVCLFGANEVSLRDAMREGATDDDLRVIISAAVKRKKAAHADMDVLVSTKNRAMIKIGG